jgi:hypothetical protein
MARRRKPGTRDWQERAHEEAEYHRRDKTAAATGLPQPLMASADKPRSSPWRWTLAGVGILVAAILIRNGLNSQAPPLTKSCATPAIALSTTSAKQGSTVRWSATGPAHTRFLIAIGVARLVPGTNPGQLHPVPDPGGSAATTELAVPASELSAGCTAHGSFIPELPAGHYNVRMFTITGSGAAVAGTAVATKPLTVTS